jgi:glycosyltransferase involved in cell wall biosynthesis
MLGDWQERRRCLGQALREVDLIVTASQFLRTLLIRYGVPPERIRQSPYGLDSSWATSLQTKAPSPRLRIGFIGQILPAKAPDLLIQAVRMLPPDAPVDVRIYGDLSKDRRYGEALLGQARGDRRVTFAGTFDNSEMGRVLSDIDVLVVPSIWYDFPLVIPSAFSTKTPVVATNLPGMNEWVRHEVDGLLFERHDAGGLASSIRRLLDEPGLLDRLRSNVPPVKTLEKYAAESVADYASLSKGRQEPAPA